MTKAELIQEGKKFNLNLKMSSTKAELESAVAEAKNAKEAKAKPSTQRRKGEN